MRHQGVGQEGAGPHPLPSPTDLRLVFVPDGRPDTIMEGGGIHLHVSPKQGLCVFVGVVSGQRPPGAPAVSQVLARWASGCGARPGTDCGRRSSQKGAAQASGKRSPPPPKGVTRE